MAGMRLGKVRVSEESGECRKDIMVVACGRLSTGKEGRPFGFRKGWY